MPPRLLASSSAPRAHRITREGLLDGRQVGAHAELLLVLPTGLVPVEVMRGADGRIETWMLLGGPIEPRFRPEPRQAGWVVCDDAHGEVVSPGDRYPEDIVIGVFYRSPGEAEALADELARRLGGRRRVCMDLGAAFYVWPDAVQSAAPVPLRVV